MSDLKDISRLIDPEFGMVRLASVHPKPLWFSDTLSAHAFCSNTSGAIAMMLEEYHRRADEPRRETVLGESASRGMGLGYTHEEALMKAVCEGIERYCGRTINPGRHEIVFGSYRQLRERGPVHAPSTWNILSAEQYAANAAWRPDERTFSKSLKIEALQADTNINWIQLPELGTGQLWWMPVQTAFLGVGIYDGGKEDEMSIAEPISTGMACGQSVTEATLSGIYEVVERDAIMGMWINRLSPPKIDLANMPVRRARLRRLLKELGRTQYEIIVNDLTSDLGIPTFFATLLHHEAPYTIVGAGCHHDPEVAVEKALMEIMMALAAFAQLELPESVCADDTIATMHDHANLYMFTDHRARLEFLNSAPVGPLRAPQWEGRSKEDILSATVASLRARGLQLFVNDVTIPEVAEVSLAVVKVVIPGLLPLNNLQRNSPFGAARVSLFRDIYKKERHFDTYPNPWPHPFP